LPVTKYRPDFCICFRQEHDVVNQFPDAEASSIAENESGPTTHIINIPTYPLDQVSGSVPIEGFIFRKAGFLVQSGLQECCDDLGKGLLGEHPRHGNSLRVAKISEVYLHWSVGMTPSQPNIALALILEASDEGLLGILSDHQRGENEPFFARWG
jgi:hypothetical protein